MAYAYGSAVFTPVIQALQEKHGSRRQYAKRENSGFALTPIGDSEAGFLAESDSFYMASIGETAWPYIQHRGGPPGFLKAIDERTLAFADFRGNKQYISTGNLMTNNRVALILVDYAAKTRLKILGRARIIEGEAAEPWIAKVHDTDSARGCLERVFIIDVEASDWNCPQHITRRFTEEQIRAALAPIEKRMRALEEENERLRSQLAPLR